jgi:hypothetical protein
VEPRIAAADDDRNRASDRAYLLHPSDPPFPPHSIPRKLLNFNPEPPQGAQNCDYIRGILVKILGTAVPRIDGAKGRQAASNADRRFSVNRA